MTGFFLSYFHLKNVPNDSNSPPGLQMTLQAKFSNLGEFRFNFFLQSPYETFPGFLIVLAVLLAVISLTDCFTSQDGEEEGQDYDNSAHGLNSY